MSELLYMCFVRVKHCWSGEAANARQQQSFFTAHPGHIFQFLPSSISSHWSTQSLCSHGNHNPMCHAKIWQGQLVKQHWKRGLNKCIIKVKRQLSWADQRAETLPQLFIWVTESQHQEGPLKPVRHQTQLVCWMGTFWLSLCLHLGPCSFSSLQSPRLLPSPVFSHLRAWIFCRALFVSQVPERCEMWQLSKFGKNSKLAWKSGKIVGNWEAVGRSINGFM